MIFLALLHAALSLHRIIENLKTDLVATRASVASRERLIWACGIVGEGPALLNEAGAHRDQLPGWKAEGACRQESHPVWASVSASVKWLTVAVLTFTVGMRMERDLA